MREEDDHRGEAECPRCAYDLRGETDRWTDTCPLESVCPECGLDIRWTHVFGPMQAVPKWSVEHPSRRFGRAVRGTFIRTLRPGRFWRSLVMTPYARPGSLVAYTIVSMVFVSLLAAIPELAIDVQFGYLSSYVSPTGAWRLSNDAALKQILSIVVGPFGTLWWSSYSWPIPRIEYELLLPVLFVALCPAAYLCLPTTLRTCTVRRIHIVRAALLSIPLAVFWFEALYLIHVLVFIGGPYLPSRGLVGAVYLVEPIAESGLTWIVPLVALQWCWWSSVNRRYLRLTNPRAVTAAMLVIAGLATLIPLFAFSNAGVAMVRLMGL